MILHDFIVLTAILLGKVEEKTVSERRILSEKGFFLCIFIIAEGIHASSLVGVDVLVEIASLHHSIIDINGFLIISVMECAISNTQQGTGIVSVEVFAVAF